MKVSNVRKANPDWFAQQDRENTEGAEQSSHYTPAKISYDTMYFRPTQKEYLVQRFEYPDSAYYLIHLLDNKGKIVDEGSTAYQSIESIQQALLMSYEMGF